jgi:hypothetical protein
MSVQGLDETTQADWSGGMCRAVARHLIPGDAAYDVRDGLLDDDGNVYQRGPTRKQTTDQLTSRTLLGVWEGSFTPGRRTIAAGAGGDVGVVGPGDTAWRKTSGTDFVSTGGIAAQVGELMFIPGGFGILMYAGSLLNAGYATGTAAFTNGSKTVTGTGTAWLANLDVGMLIRPATSGFFGVIASIDSNTQVTLVDGWQGATAAAGAYSATPYAIAPFTPLTGDPQYAGVASVANRLLWADGRRVLMSNTIDQDTGQPRLWVHDVDDYHEFPADIVALATLRDTVFVFTKAGIWTISNVGLPIIDAYGNGQHRVQKLSGDVVLRSPGGVTPWRDSLVLCAVGGVYVMDAGGGLELISRSITPLWQTQLNAAFTIVCQAIAYRDHLFVTVRDSRFPLIPGNTWVGRLDRRTNTPVGKSAPWTRFIAGEAANLNGLAVQDPYGAAKLVGGGYGYLLDLSGLFLGGALPSNVGGTNDADGTIVAMFVETREYVLDAGALATLRDVALEYESTDGQLIVAAAAGTRTTAGNPPTYTTLASTAAGNFQTQNPRVLSVRREARRASFTITGSVGGPGVSGWRLRAVRLRTRLRGRRR